MTFTDSKRRFSNRAADYARYRPAYPLEVLDVLRDWCALKPEHFRAVGLWYDDFAQTPDDVVRDLLLRSTQSRSEPDV